MKLCPVVLDRELEIHYQASRLDRALVPRARRTSPLSKRCAGVVRRLLLVSRGDDSAMLNGEMINYMRRVFSTAHCLLSSTYCFFLLPGLTTNSPRAHASQTDGSTEGTLRLANDTRGTPTSAFPPDRSIIDAAATTFAPLACNASTVSRVEPPVVTTSSTTSSLSPGVTEKPRRKIILPFSRSVQMNRASRARATSCPIIN